MNKSSVVDEEKLCFVSFESLKCSLSNVHTKTDFKRCQTSHISTCTYILYKYC